MKLFLSWLAGTAVVATMAAILLLSPGETGTLLCDGDELLITRETITRALYSCIAYTPTPAPTLAPTATVAPTVAPTAIPPTATPAHDHADMAWHAPGAHGDRPYHEHGDAVPAWVTAAGYSPTYDHVGGTPNENHAYYKHTGFKGWAGRFNNVDWYGVFHLDFNPGGHSGRFHSYQLWLRDSTGAVSHMHGWLDFGTGNNTGSNLIVTCGVDSGIRPIIKVNQAGCPVQFENWYARAGQAGWMADFGFNIDPNYFAGGDPTNPATWTSRDGEGWHNLNRRIEFAWYANRSAQRGEFWTTQFGNVVSGPNDAACGSTVAVGEKSYTVVCLKQVIQPTLPAIQFPGNSVQRTFPEGNGVLLPN